MNAKIRGLVEANDRLVEQTKMLQGIITAHRDENAELQRQLAQLEAALDMATERISDLEDRNRELLDQLHEAALTIDLLRAEQLPTLADLAVGEQ